MVETTDGEFELKHKTIPEGTILQSWDSDIGSHPLMFKEPHNIVALHEIKNQRLWMSDSPMEVNTSLPFIDEAEGDVLIGGLGLGVVPTLLAQKDEVKSITVVELSKSVIDLVAWQLDIPNLTIIEGDIWDYMKNTDCMYDSIFGDIWPDMNSAKDEGDKFYWKAIRCRRYEGIIKVWLEEFWDEMQGPMEEFIEEYKDGKYDSHTSLELVYEPCIMCAKTPRANFGAFCMDCIDFVMDYR